MVHLSNHAYVKVSEIEAVFPIDAAPIRRMIAQAKEKGLWVDLSYGVKSKTVVLLKTGKLLESNIGSKVITKRIEEVLNK